MGGMGMGGMGMMNPMMMVRLLSTAPSPTSLLSLAPSRPPYVPAAHMSVL